MHNVIKTALPAIAIHIWQLIQFVLRRPVHIFYIVQTSVKILKYSSTEKCIKLLRHTLNHFRHRLQCFRILMGSPLFMIYRIYTHMVIN